MEGPVIDIILVVAAAFFGGFGARLLRFPPVIGYITAGIIFGLVGKQYITSYENLHQLSEIGVALLLFTLGFEFSFEKLRRLNRTILVAGFFQIVLVAVVLFPVLMLFRLPLPVALLFAMLFTFSSTAVVLKALEERGVFANFPSSQVFAFLLIQNLFIVPVIFILPLLFGSSVGFGDVGQFIFSCIKAGALFLLILFVSRFFLSKVLHRLLRYPTYEFVLLATIFISFLSIGLFSMVGIPVSIAAFLAGVLISEQGKNLSPLSVIRPFRDVLLVLFFAIAGMLLDIHVLTEILPLIIFLSILVLGAKFLSIFLVMRGSSHSLFPAVLIASHLAHIGEFSIVIGLIALARGYIHVSSYTLLLSIFIVSQIAFPFFIKYAHIVFEYIVERGWLSEKGKGELATHRIVRETKELKNHVIICGHGRVGREVRHLLDDAGLPYVVVDFDRKIYHELLRANKAAILGDPSDPEVLKAASISSAKVLVLAVPDAPSQKKVIKSALKENPKIIIVCRSHEDEHRYDLLNLGANTIVIPEFEAGIRIGHAVLDVFGVKRMEISAYIQKLRRQHFID